MTISRILFTCTALAISASSVAGTYPQSGDAKKAQREAAQSSSANIPLPPAPSRPQENKRSAQQQVQTKSNK